MRNRLARFAVSRRRQRLFPAGFVLVGGIGVLTVVSCDSDGPPTSPGTPGGGFVSLRLTAPERITPGQSVQLRAEAITANGSAENVSAQASWASSNGLVVQVSSSGLATAGTRGESIVQVRHRDKVAQQHVFVLPDGTFALAGTVRESVVGIGGVSLRVVDGVGQNIVTFSDPDGSYTLFGVSGRIRIRLTKPDYAENLQDVDVATHRRQDFEIVPERPRDDYRGTYTLRITARLPCEGISAETFPEAVTRREYTANVEQDGPRISVTLSGADFLTTSGHGNGFVGSLDISGRLAFSIGSPNFDYYGPWYYGLPELAERVGDTTLIVSGVVSVQGGPPRLSGTLDGFLLTADRSTYPFGPPYRSVCVGQHGFEMVRR